MLKFTLSIMACAMLMFIFGGMSNSEAFAIWGDMFVLSAIIIMFLGTRKHGS